MFSIIAPAGNTNGVAVVWPISKVGRTTAPEVVAVIGAIKLCCEQRAAPVLSGAITPLLVGLLRLKMRIGPVNVLDMFNSLS